MSRLVGRMQSTAIRRRSAPRHRSSGGPLRCRLDKLSPPWSALRFRRENVSQRDRQAKLDLGPTITSREHTAAGCPNPAEFKCGKFWASPIIAPQPEVPAVLDNCPPHTLT